MPAVRKLGRPTDQRMAMLRAMTTYLLENGQIKTTVTRAKEVAPLAEKMITHRPPPWRCRRDGHRAAGLITDLNMKIPYRIPGAPGIR